VEDAREEGDEDEEVVWMTLKILFVKIVGSKQ